MFARKIQKDIHEYFASRPEKILIVDGARQVGKSFIIRYEGQRFFKNYIELNMLEDSQGNRAFANIGSVDDFYIQLSTLAGDRMGEKDETLVFLDEIQTYPKLITLLKFLKQDNRFTYIASGSLLGVTLRDEVASLPIGSVEIKRMYPMDFEEFLWANGVGQMAIDSLKDCFSSENSPSESLHNTIMKHFRMYLLSGGLPDAVKELVLNRNIASMRKVQNDIRAFYGADASKYDTERKLKIRRIYDSIPSLMENRKKRVVAKDIEGKKGKTFEGYQDEFDYLISSGIALDVKAVSTPVFPLLQNSDKNLLKLYMNDVGILTSILYSLNINSILNDEICINLGSVYETAVASELKAHGHDLFYYDNRKKGEVDFLVNDYDSLSVIPLEVKSGKDYTIHAALNRFVSNPDYHVKRSYVFSNEREIFKESSIIYMPVYMVMFV